MLVTAVEGGDNLEPLDGLLPALDRQGALALRWVDHRTKGDLLLVKVDPVDELSQGVGAHPAVEIVTPSVFQLPPKHLVFDYLPGEEALELLPGPVQDVEFLFILLPSKRQVLLGSLLAGPQVGLGATLGLHLGQLGLEVLLAAVQFAVTLLLDGSALVNQFLFQFREILVPAVLIDADHQVGGEVDDLLQLLGLEVLAGLVSRQQVGQPRTGTPEVPDVDCWCGQFNVAHAFPADFRARDLHPAAFANNSLEPDSLVLPAVALPVLGGTKDLLAEQPVLLGLERAVVDGLGLLNLAVRPHANGVRSGQADPYLVELVDVDHSSGPRSVRAVPGGSAVVG